MTSPSIPQRLAWANQVFLRTGVPRDALAHMFSRSPSNISHWFTGRIVPSIEVVRRLERFANYAQDMTDKETCPMTPDEYRSSHAERWQNLLRRCPGERDA
jgi:hypothetical protein